MNNPLEKSRQKVTRANEHIANIEIESGGFFASEPYTLIVEPDPDSPGQEIHKLRLNEPLPEIVEHLTIEAAHHLRTALDNACYAVAVAAGSKPSPGECAFPFSRSAETFENSMKGRTKQLPEEIRTLFRTLKPYRGGNDALWALNEIDNADKHALLGIGSGAFIFSASFPLSAVPKPCIMPIRPIWDSTNHEIELGSYPAQENTTSKVDFGLFVTFDEIEVAHGEPVVAFLRYLVRAVNHILNAIDSECQRIGIFP